MRPWREKIDRATTLKELVALRVELSRFKVLDPACGSGNFLYVAFRELARLDMRLMTRLQTNFSHKEFIRRVTVPCVVSPKQFFGIDNDTFGVELAKVTLMLAKKLALDEAVETFSDGEAEYGKGIIELEFGGEQALPLDNLDNNIVCDDALFCDWPECNAIIGNPPYQSKNKIQQELGRTYLNRLRERHPEVDGRADYCVYWFRRAHDYLKSGERAGLVGTNSIRQNYSRAGSLDYIVEHNGTIIEAVSSMAWLGEANVHVSIVNWIKDQEGGLKRLYNQAGSNPEIGWNHVDMEQIGSSLSFELDVTKARCIEANAKDGECYQGQTHGHKAFLMKPNGAKLLIASEKRYADVVKPFLIANDLIGAIHSRPSRYVIDFSGLDVLEAQCYPAVFERIEKQVLPPREKAAKKEEEQNEKARADNAKGRVNRHHANFLKKWWQMSYPREEMISSLQKLNRYIVCGRVTKRPIFEFIHHDISPNDALQVFPYDDDYSFGILQSGMHWQWFIAKCSTLKSDFRYTSNTVFDTFPWPQSPTLAAVKKVAQAAVTLREQRRGLRMKHGLSFRELYRTLEKPGDHPLKDAQFALDEVVRAAYSMKKKDVSLAFLLNLNFEVADLEAKGKTVQGPGLPHSVVDRAPFITGDCILP